MLYCDWAKRDSLLVTHEEFTSDLFGLTERLAHLIDDNGNPLSLKKSQYYFLPPYEWYNDTISAWTAEYGKQLINFTPGTLSTADYTTPEMKNYRATDVIYKSIVDYEKSKPAGLNGFLLLLHIGTDPKRTDKFLQTVTRINKILQSEGIPIPNR